MTLLIRLTVVLLATLIHTPTTQAYFVLDPEAAQFTAGYAPTRDWVPIANADRGSLVEVGQGVGATVDGMGARIPLMTALKMVIPADWTVFKQAGLSVHKRVSWHGGRPWPAILGAIGRGNGYRITVDWERRYVFIEKAVAPGWIAQRHVAPVKR